MLLLFDCVDNVAVQHTRCRRLLLRCTVSTYVSTSVEQIPRIMRKITCTSGTVALLFTSVQRFASSDSIFSHTRHSWRRVREYEALTLSRKETRMEEKTCVKPQNSRLTLLFYQLAMASIPVWGSACASSLYKGTLSRNSTYANRGFGIVLSASTLSERWWVFDPQNPDQGPSGLAPVEKKTRLDLDGDGFLRLDETTVHFEPTLRLMSREDPRAVIELDVDIIKRSDSEKVTAQQLFDDAVLRRTSDAKQTQRVLKSAETMELAFDRTALVATISSDSNDQGEEQFALVDQPDFKASEGTPRRQVLWLSLRAPKLSASLKKDFNQLLRNLLVTPKAGPQTQKEKW